MSSEVATLSRLRIRSTRPRWARIIRQMISEKKNAEGREKPTVREEEAVHSDADHLEEKALKEKENVEHKSKQKVSPTTDSFLLNNSRVYCRVRLVGSPQIEMYLRINLHLCVQSGSQISPRLCS